MFNNMYGNFIPQQYTPQMQRLQQMEMQYPQFAQNQNTMQQPQQMQQNILGLQGKIVDNIEVVKAMDIPLDGSISYFPMADGSAIVTKQLQTDGTSKTIIFKPVDMKELKQEANNYITREELEEMLKTEPGSIKEMKDEMKTLKRQIRDIVDDIKEAKRKD